PKCEVSPEKRGGWSKKADFGVNTSEFWSNENFKREQAGYDEGAIHLFAPSLGYIVGVLLALGAVAFNLGNVSGSALGINVLTGINTTGGALITGGLGIGLFLLHNAAKRMDQMAKYLGLFMILLIAYVALKGLPNIAPELINKTSLDFSFSNASSLLLPILLVVGGSVGGYYTGAHRLIDCNFTGIANVNNIKRAGFTGIIIAGTIQTLLFLAVLAVVVTGVTLDLQNPAADAFKHGAGEIGYFIFGFVLFFASITSVIGNSYMAISLLKTIFPVVGRNEKYWCIGFIVVTTLATIVMGKPVLLLMVAGLVNSFILPVVLTTLMLATKKKEIVGNYEHPKWLTILGSIMVIVMVYGGFLNASSFFAKIGSLL
ncbi:divalent metal cation transporter, partial [Aeromonas jandaei]